MNAVIGAVRLTMAALALVAGLMATMLAAVFPFRFRGARWSAWCVTWTARAVNHALGVHFVCTNPALYASHHGLIFANHSSYLDITSLLYVAPARFLAASEVRNKPVVGWIASSVETIYVDRRNKESRRSARGSVSEVLKHDPYPPIILFPEGRLGPGEELMPFRYGAFELAVENERPYLLCALRYNRPEITTWYGGTRNENMIAAAWRLATFRGEITAELVTIGVTHPTKADDAALLATIAQRTVEKELGFPAGPTGIDEAPPAQWQRA